MWFDDVRCNLIARLGNVELFVDHMSRMSCKAIIADTQAVRLRATTFRPKTISHPGR